MRESADIIYAEEAYQIVGACLEVYNTLGSGFLESVYHNALEVEFRIRRTPFVTQEAQKIFYKEVEIGHFIPDFICHDKIILELKAESKIYGANRSQVLNYLKATGYRLGLLVNFGSSKRLEWERIVL